MTRRVALITGAASGIGYAVAEHLLDQGYRIVLSDLDNDNAQAAKTQLIDKQSHDQGDDQAARIMACQLDVTNDESIQACVAQVKQHWNRLDTLINNAGIQHVAPLETFPPAQWRKIQDVLLVGPALLTRECLPLMRAQNFGRIINIGSIHSLVASPYKSAYVAAKHGLLGFAKTLALEVADQNITINTLCPAYIKTPLVEQQIADQAKAHGLSENEVIENIMLAPMPQKRFVAMEELCRSVSFLASGECRSMTGQTLVIDGGWVAQ